ncbi:hypothetical protein BJ138DRAFT_1146455 [Hygrophoropsis aurantiaca]|uniref:Uncharacterized protein n=1 Tax=Hygrophoropsis aurantiaca TaxID=72124 RepID=A0ACB8AJ01_9AGAM|nr:hypothetical protein BJ138DRAFT_1146455 [Hygrophoropsis aurantiaca]
MTRNKNRIYMAFYSRSGGSDYHLALLLSPKNPKPNDRDTRRFHAMNRPDPNRISQQEWVYESIQVFGRTSRLLALALLGKTEMDDNELSDLLASVKLVQDDANWNCRSWVFSAIEVLRSNGIITATPLSPNELYVIGSQVASEFLKLTPAAREKVPVPTCDAAGKTISSEMK